MSKNEVEQREQFLERKQKIEELLRVLFKILDNIKSDSNLNLFVLALINGILEDKRTRVRNIIAMEKSANATKKVEAVRILFDFLLQNNHEGSDAIDQRDLAAHSLSQIIANMEFSLCEHHAKHFLNYLMERNKSVSDECKSACLLMLMKTNELASIFTERQGFYILEKWLKTECLKKDQLAYNVIATLWILSYHEFALPPLGDYTLNIIELVSKVLDYFNKEKIVRIVCMFFDVSYDIPNI